MAKIISIIANIIYIIILNLELYTNRATMQDGRVREWHHNALDMLNMADLYFLFYLLIFGIVVSTVTAILGLIGTKADAIRKAWMISSVTAFLLFVIILIVAGNTHAKYS